MSTVVIRTDGRVTSVLVDGVDYSKEATKVVFKHIAGDIPTVSLTFIPDEVEIVGVIGSFHPVKNGRATERDTTKEPMDIERP